jgi:hypothetical protein
MTMAELPGDPAVMSRRGLAVRLATLAAAALLGIGGASGVTARRKRSRTPWSPTDGQFDAAGAGDNSSGSDDRGDSNSGSGATGPGGTNSGGDLTGDDTVGQDAAGDAAVGDSNQGTNAGAGDDATGKDGVGDDAVSVVVSPTRGGRWRRP